MSDTTEPPKPKPLDICKICALGLIAYFGAPELAVLI